MKLSIFCTIGSSSTSIDCSSTSIRGIVFFSSFDNSDDVDGGGISTIGGSAVPLENDFDLNTSFGCSFRKCALVKEKLTNYNLMTFSINLSY